MTIGIIPAAGKAERMGGLQKFLLPIPENDFLIRRICRQMYIAGAETVTIGASPANYSMPRFDIDEAHPFYVDVGDTATMNETVLNMRASAPSYQITLFGMPDTYIANINVFSKMSDAILRTGADVVVGMFRARSGQHTEGGMCILEGERVTGIVDKPPTRFADWIWGALAWRDTFWGFIDPKKPHVGFAVQSGIEAGLNVYGVKCGYDDFWDCGTHTRYFSLINYLTGCKS